MPSFCVTMYDKSKMSTNNTKQAAWIGIGSLMSFCFSIISSMILSRYFDKADYGTYKQVFYVYDTLLVVFTLGLPRAYSYFLPRVDFTQSRSLIIKISLVFLLMGIIMSISLYVFAEQIGIILKNNDLPEAIRIFAIVPTLMLPTMGLDGILATFKRAKLMAVYNIVTKIIMLLCTALPVLLFDMNYKEALIGFVLASFLSFIIAEILIFSPYSSVKNEKTNVSYHDIFVFSLPLLFASLWGILQNSADSFFVSRYFGKEVFAEFVNGNFELPFVSMIVGACATVLSPVFSKLSSEDSSVDEIKTLWIGVFEKSAMLIYPLVLYFIFFASDIMVLLYGENYEVSSTYFIIKTLVCFTNVIAIGPLLINVGYVRFYSIVQMFSAIAVVILDSLSILIINSPYAISVVQLVCKIGGTVVYLIVIAKYFSTTIWKLIPQKSIFKILIVSISLLICMRLITSILCISRLLGLVVSFTVYSIAFYLITLYLDLDYKLILRSFKR